MSNYVEWDDVIRRYSQLSRLNRGSVELNDSFIAPAERELDSRLAGFFTVPFSTTNQTAIDLVIDITFYRAGLGKEKDRTVLKKDLDNRINMLKDGEAAMMISSTNGTITAEFSGGRTPWSDTQDFIPAFGHGPFEEYIVDSSQIESERIARGDF